MGNRLSKIVTKTGDMGITGLGDGSRISKASDRIDAIGDVDELNCVIGLVISRMKEEWMDSSVHIGYYALMNIQHQLFDLGGELSIPEHIIISEDDVIKLEHYIEEWNSKLPHLKNFMLPSGNELFSRLHHARAVARRAERSVVQLFETTIIKPQSLLFLNRLSDLLFVLARTHADFDEVLWKPKEKRNIDV